MSRDITPPPNVANGVAGGTFAAMATIPVVWAIGISCITLHWWHHLALWAAGSGTWLLTYLPPVFHDLGVPWSIDPSAPVNQWPVGLGTEVGWATVVALIAGGVAGLIFGIRSAAVPAEHHVGGRYLATSVRRFAHILRRREGADGLWIHARIRLARVRERRHILAIGSSGSGKTQVLHRLIGGSIARGDQQLVFDYKSELIPVYYDADATLIAPWDARGTDWDIAADVPDLPAARELAAALIPLPQTGDPKWVSGARQILTGLVVALQQQPGGWSMADLSRAASADGETIAATLRQYFPEAAGLLTNPSTNPATSYLASLVDYLAPIHDLARLTAIETETRRPRWSVRRWLAGGESARVIVGYDQGQAELSRFMIAAILRLVLQRVGSAGFEKPAAPTWLFLDEFIQAGKIDPILNLSEVARSKDIRLILACQSIERLREVYGRESADALAGGIGTLIIGRCRGETARWASDQVGEQQLERYRASVNDEGETRHWDRVSEPVMRPETFDAALGNFGRGHRMTNRLLLLAGGDAVAQLDWRLWVPQCIAPVHKPRGASAGNEAPTPFEPPRDPDAALSLDGAPAEPGGQSPAHAVEASAHAPSTRAARLAQLKAAVQADDANRTEPE